MYDVFHSNVAASLNHLSYTPQHWPVCFVDRFRPEETLADSTERQSDHKHFGRYLKRNASFIYFFFIIWKMKLVRKRFSVTKIFFFIFQFQSRRETAQVTMMYRIVYHLVDIPADQYLHPSSLRTRGHQLRFLVPHTRTTVYRTAFFPQAIRLWNQLPACVVGANTLDSFKAQLSRANTN